MEGQEIFSSLHAQGNFIPRYVKLISEIHDALKELNSELLTS
jgi:hypothetical protein